MFLDSGLVCFTSVELLENKTFVEKLWYWDNGVLIFLQTPTGVDFLWYDWIWIIIWYIMIWIIFVYEWMIYEWFFQIGWSVFDRFWFEDLYWDKESTQIIGMMWWSSAGRVPFGLSFVSIASPWFLRLDQNVSSFIMIPFTVYLIWGEFIECMETLIHLLTLTGVWLIW